MVFCRPGVSGIASRVRWPKAPWSGVEHRPGCCAESAPPSLRPTRRGISQAREATLVPCRAPHRPRASNRFSEVIHRLSATPCPPGDARPARRILRCEPDEVDPPTDTRKAGHQDRPLIVAAELHRHDPHPGRHRPAVPASWARLLIIGKQRPSTTRDHPARCPAGLIHGLDPPPPSCSSSYRRTVHLSSIPTDQRISPAMTCATCLRPRHRDRPQHASSAATASTQVYFADPHSHLSVSR